MMNTKRIMSRESAVYHRENCIYAGRIKRENMLITTGDEAKYRGYRPCRCCNGMKYHVTNSQGTITYYEKYRGMQFLFRDGILYVKTDMGC